METAAAPDAPATRDYTRAAVALHWTVAGLVITLLAMGWIMTNMPVSPAKLQIVTWHKWGGITVLALFFMRALWRLTHPAPPLLPMPLWQQRAANIVHALLYVLLLVQPLSGWLYSSAAGRQVVYLNLIPLPNLIGRNPAAAALFKNLHETCGALLAAFVALHVLAALKHHFVDRDDTLRRMLAWRST
jgi:cytochrome b561